MEKTSKTPIRDQAVRDFIHSRNSASTKASYEAILIECWAYIGAKELSRITFSDLAAFKDSLTRLHPNTIHMYTVVLRCFFNFCVELDLIAKSPAAKLKSPKVQRRPPTFLTEDEATRLLISPDRNTLYGKRDYAVLALLLGTGVRLNEITQVRFADFFVDDHRDIFLNILRGKGDKPRRVKVPAEVFAAVQEFATAVCKYKPLEPRGMPLCLRLHGYLSWVEGDIPIVRLSRRQVQSIVSEAAKRAGIQKNVSPHMLRHTCFTLEMINGASILEIQEQAGHGYLGTTQKYLHLVDSMKHNAVNRNPLFLRADPRTEKEVIKHGVVERLKRLGVSAQAIEVIREELHLGNLPRPQKVDPERWMPLNEAVAMLSHLGRSARTLMKAITDGDVKTLERGFEMWVWRAQVLELLEEFIQMREAAKLFEVNEKTIRRWIASGALVQGQEARRWGGKWIVRHTAVARLLGKTRTNAVQNADMKSKRGQKKQGKPRRKAKPR